jgi:hypothetical protein
MKRIRFGALAAVALGGVSLAVVTVLSKSASAQDILSGHIGVATPIVTYSSSSTTGTTTIGDTFNILFPFGIGVKPNWSPVVFDFEFVPEVHPNSRSVTMLLHPGVILPLQDGWAVGIRAAFEVNQNSVGFTPLVNKSFPVSGQKFRWFVEGDLPVRFTRTVITLPSGRVNNSDATSVGFVLHLGLAF